MGQIANYAMMDLANYMAGSGRPKGGQPASFSPVANSGQSGNIPIVQEHKKKEAHKEKILKAKGFKNGIRDDENDWLSRQLKEEAEALVRMNEMFGIRKGPSDAMKLKMEHEKAHAKARAKETAFGIEIIH